MTKIFFTLLSIFSLNSYASLEAIHHTSCELGKINIYSLYDIDNRDILRNILSKGYKNNYINEITQDGLLHTASTGLDGRLEINLGQYQFSRSVPERDFWHLDRYYRRLENRSHRRLRLLQVIQHESEMYPIAHTNEHREINEAFSPNNSRQNKRAIEWALRNLPRCQTR